MRKIISSDLGLVDFTSDPLYQQYLKVFNKYLEDVKSKPTITHIIAVGSFVNGCLDPSSDLDFFVIDNTKIDQVESTWIHSLKYGIKVDQLIMNSQTLQKLVENEEHSHLRLYSQAIANGVLVHVDNSIQKNYRFCKKDW